MIKDENQKKQYAVALVVLAAILIATLCIALPTASAEEWPATVVLEENIAFGFDNMTVGQQGYGNDWSMLHYASESGMPKFKNMVLRVSTGNQTVLYETQAYSSENNYYVAQGSTAFRFVPMGTAQTARTNESTDYLAVIINNRGTLIVYDNFNIFGTAMSVDDLAIYDATFFDNTGLEITYAGPKTVQVELNGITSQNSVPHWTFDTYSPSEELVMYSYGHTSLFDSNYPSSWLSEQVICWHFNGYHNLEDFDTGELFTDESYPTGVFTAYFISNGFPVREIDGYSAESFDMGFSRVDQSITIFSIRMVANSFRSYTTAECRDVSNKFLANAYVIGYAYSVNVNNLIDDHAAPTGYEFEGWYYDELCNYPIEDSVTPGTITAYKKCTIKTFEIEFRNVGITLATATYNYAATPIIPDGLANEGYTFDGWYADEYLTTPYVVAPMTDDVVVYGKYIPIVYTVIFKNGNTVVNTQSIAYGGTATAPRVIAPEGYELAGWYNGDSVVATDLSKVVTSDLTLTAHFKSITHTVTLTNCGEVYLSISVPHRAPLFGTTGVFEDGAVASSVAAVDLAALESVYADTVVTEDMSIEVTMTAKMIKWNAFGLWMAKNWGWLVGGIVAAVIAVIIFVTEFKKR